MPSIYSNHLLDNDNNYQRAKPLNDNGILPYDSNLDYSQANGTLVKGSDNNVYQAMQDNGPSSAVVDPVGDNSGVWELAYFSPKNPQPKNYIVNSDNAVNQENSDGPNVLSNGVEFFQADQLSSSFSNTGGASTTRRTLNSRGFYDVEYEVTTAHTNLTGTNNAAPFKIELEAGSIRHLNGRSVTFWLSCEATLAGKYPVSFIGKSPVDRTFITEIDLNIGVNFVPVTVTFEGNTIDSSLPDNALGLEIFFGVCNEGTLQTSTKDTWQTGRFTSTNTQLQWVKTGTETLKLGERLLVEGNVAPKYQPYTDAVYNVFRYFERLDYDNFGYVGTGQARTVNLLQVRIDYSRKRSNNPNVGLSNINNFLIIIGGGSTSVVSIAANQRSQNVSKLDIDGAINFNINDCLALEGKASGAYIDINDRL